MGLLREAEMMKKPFTIALRIMHHKSISVFILLVIAVLFPSCEKDHFWDFAKSTGDIVTVTRPVNENFTKIHLNDDVNLVITQGNTYSIRVEGGENILSGIETSISDSLLTIRNNNKFNWVRSYDKKFTAYVTMPHIIDLKYEATSTVTNTDTIREDSLTVSAVGGSGYIDLIIKTGTSKLSIIYGSVDMKISGQTGVNFIYSASYGPFHCLDLESGFVFMRNASTNDCYVNVKHHFEYEITSLGNIYYKGNPEEISGTVSGSGKLLKYD
jgi:hypothetical protein